MGKLNFYDSCRVYIRDEQIPVKVCNSKRVDILEFSILWFHVYLIYDVITLLDGVHGFTEFYFHNFCRA